MGKFSGIFWQNGEAEKGLINLNSCLPFLYTFLSLARAPPICNYTTQNKIIRFVLIRNLPSFSPRQQDYQKAE